MHVIVADSVYARASRLERGLEFDLFSAIVSIPNALNISEFFGEGDSMKIVHLNSFAS